MCSEHPFESVPCPPKCPAIVQIEPYWLCILTTIEQTPSHTASCDSAGENVKFERKLRGRASL
jgi:hypothetical protein